MSAVAGRREHWQRRYTDSADDTFSWFESEPRISLELIEEFGAGPGSSIIDIGGGASRLVDALVRAGWNDVSVLDISAAALEVSRSRLAAQAGGVNWIVADITSWEPGRSFDLWHDRAAFHFLTDAANRSAYVARMTAALRPGGHAIIATFAPDGPEKCSGLPVVRYDERSLAEAIGGGFSIVTSRRHEHRTPGGGRQAFMFHVFRRD